MPAVYEAVVCDLLSALLDSWSLWHRVAGTEEEGRGWGIAFLDRVSGGEPYSPYLDLIAEAAGDAGLPLGLAEELGRRWDELEPWPEVPGVLGRVDVPIAVVTNCSEELGVQAATRLGVEIAAVASTERAGQYKSHPDTYAHAAGMDVLWHDRARLGSDKDLPALAVLDSLESLPRYLDAAR